MANVTLEERIKKAVNDADSAFWSEIVKHFPEVLTGDFAPDETIQFNNAQELAVKRWLKNNSTYKL